MRSERRSAQTPVLLASAVMVLLGCILMLRYRSFLVHEASESLVMILERGVAFRIDHALVDTRPAMWITLAPMLLLSQVTDHLPALVMAFGIPHVLIPFLSVTGACLLLRGRPPEQQFLAVAGIGLAGLPAQIDVATGQMMVVQLHWIFLALIVTAGAGRRRLAMLGLMAAYLLLRNPTAAVLVTFAGGFLLLEVLAGRASRIHLPSGALLVALGGARGIWGLLSPSDMMRLRDETHPSLMRVLASFTHPERGLFVLYFALVIAAATLMLSVRLRRSWLPAVLVLAAGAVLLSIAAANAAWLELGRDYIIWSLPVALVLSAIFLHIALPDPETREDPRTMPIGMAASLLAPAFVFLVVVGCGARMFDGQLRHARLEVEQQALSCVDLGSLFQGWTSSLDDRFRAFEYTYLASSPDRVVTRVVLDPERCRRVCPAVEPERAYFQLEMRDASGALRRCSLQHVLE